MPIYKEKKDKLKLNISDSEESVKITVDTYHGTNVSVRVSLSGEINKKVPDPDNPDDDTNNTIVIGKASDLIGKTIRFTGSARNPDGDQIKVSHSIFEGDDNSLIYTFPNDYTGTNNYANSDQVPTYRFYVTFMEEES